MMRRMYDFKCVLHNHLFEAFIESEVRTTMCNQCESEAERIVSMPMIRLEGVSGDFPGAAMQWERKHAQQLAVERKRNRD